MIPPKLCKAKLSDKVVLNEKFTQFYFEMTEPNALTFEAGQYVSLAVDPAGHRRSYSICSTPSKEHGFELLLDVAPNGMGVRYLNSLEFGQEASMLAPMGMFTVSEQVVDKPLVFIATGSGITPFRSMVLDQLQIKKNTQPMILHWGLRHVETMFWEDEFEELSENFPNFKFHPVISQAPEQWPLCRGRVTDCLLVHDLIPDAHYYLCGNDKMIADTMATLAQRGVPKENIHHEKFY
jgi:ferredoxin-NADP reductase